MEGHPPNLADLPLKLTYRTGRDDLVRGWFLPTSFGPHSGPYRRAAAA